MRLITQYNVEAILWFFSFDFQDPPCKSSSETKLGSGVSTTTKTIQAGPLFNFRNNNLTEQLNKKRKEDRENE